MRILWASEFPDADYSTALALAQQGHEVRRVAFSPPTSSSGHIKLPAFRESTRQQIDAEIASFDPQLIHCPAVWVLGQLALESGVPYTLAVGDEMDALRQDLQIAELAQQAAENAGRIFVDNEAMRSCAINEFSVEADRVVVIPRESTTDYAERLAEEFRAMLIERFGKMPE